jgi:hypothetical protein
MQYSSFFPKRPRFNRPWEEFAWCKITLFVDTLRAWLSLCTVPSILTFYCFSCIPMDGDRLGPRIHISCAYIWDKDNNKRNMSHVQINLNIVGAHLNSL